jgi:hypothetical protein
MRVRKVHALIAAATIAVSACSDSTGPGSLDSHAALQSLALGLGQLGPTESPTAMDADAAFSSIAPLLNQVTVAIDGTPQSMYAFALRESFPAGTCLEDLFPDPFLPPDQGTCTPPPPEVAAILWQTHSASAPPDKLLLLVGNVGTTSYEFSLDSPDFPAMATYIEGPEGFWESTSGTLTTQVASTNQGCNITLPPYVKSGSCSFATFTAQGSIVFEEFSFGTVELSPGVTVATKTINIPSITLHGLWLSITEIQAAPLALRQQRSITSR